MAKRASRSTKNGIASETILDAKRNGASMGIMKQLLVSTVLILVTASVWAQGIPNRIWVDSELTTVQEPVAISFFQQESLDFNVMVRENGLTSSFSTNAVDMFAKWEVMSVTNPLSAYIVSTADMSMSTSGLFRFTVQPRDTMLAPGRYDGYVRLFERVLDSTEYRETKVLSRQVIDVRFAPNSQNYNFVGPIWFDAFDPANFTAERVTASQVEAFNLRLLKNDEIIDEWNDVKTFLNNDLGIINTPNDSYPWASASIIGNGLSYPRTLRRIAGEDGIATFVTNNTLVITGNSTQSVNQLFPIQPTNTGRFYYRSWPHPGSLEGKSFRWVDLTNSPPSTLFLGWNGTNFFPTTGTQGEATNAVLLGGEPPKYYRSAASHNDFWILNSPNGSIQADPLILGAPIDDVAQPARVKRTFKGIIAGDNVNVSPVTWTDDGETRTLWRLDAYGPTNAGMLHTSNRWTGANIFQPGLTVENRIIRNDAEVQPPQNRSHNSGAWSSVGIGGRGTVASGTGSTVAGGQLNTANGLNATLGGGQFNSAGGDFAVVSGGGVNRAGGIYSSIIGGNNNQANGAFSAVLGGELVQANATLSFGSGRFIKLEHARNWGFGRGFSGTNFLESATNNVFWIHDVVEPMRFGLNTVNPTRTFDVRGDGIVTGNLEAGSFTLNGVTISSWPTGGGGGTGSVLMALGDLTDVALGGLQTNYTIQWNGSLWVPVPFPQSGLASPALAGATNRLLSWTGTNASGSNVFNFVDYVPLGTNDLTASNGVLYLNGILAGGGGTASLTQQWSVLYSDGDTNSQSLAIGASNRFLRSNGTNAAPSWEVVETGTDGAAVTGIVNSIIVASNLVSSSTVSNIASAVISASDLVSPSTASNIANAAIGSSNLISVTAAQALANSANATSIHGRAWTTNAPPIAGAVPYWTGSEIDWSPAPPASSTGSVTQINGQVGVVSLTTVGTSDRPGVSSWSGTELRIGTNENRNASIMTNFPSTLLTIQGANANYWRITSIPTGATASGSSGQIAAKDTNVYFYVTNFEGTGTGRWIRINAEANW
jgi:hypothetical protein